MTDTTAPAAAGRTPVHLWIVGVVALLWNGYGGFDYIMTKTNNAAYLAAYTPEQREYFNSFPLWADVAWAIGVWGGVLGAVLLLLRMKWAFHAFVASLIGFVATVIYGQMSASSEIMGSTGLIFSAIIFVICLFLVWYSWTMTKRGVLR